MLERDHDDELTSHVAGKDVIGSLSSFVSTTPHLVPCYFIPNNYEKDDIDRVMNYRSHLIVFAASNQSWRVDRFSYQVYI